MSRNVAARDESGSMTRIPPLPCLEVGGDITMLFMFGYLSEPNRHSKFQSHGRAGSGLPIYAGLSILGHGLAVL